MVKSIMVFSKTSSKTIELYWLLVSSRAYIRIEFQQSKNCGKTIKIQQRSANRERAEKPIGTQCNWFESSNIKRVNQWKNPHFRIIIVEERMKHNYKKKKKLLPRVWITVAKSSSTLNGILIYTIFKRNSNKPLIRLKYTVSYNTLLYAQRKNGRGRLNKIQTKIVFALKIQ